MRVAYKLNAVCQYFPVKFLNEVNVLPCQKLHYTQYVAHSVCSCILTIYYRES